MRPKGLIKVCEKDFDDYFLNLHTYLKIGFFIRMSVEAEITLFQLLKQHLYMVIKM